MTEKRQTSQGYIIHILQHFATKLRNTTNFCDALSSCDEIFVEAYLDQNFTHKGKGLLGATSCLYIEFIHGSVKSTQNMKNFLLKTTFIHPNQR